VFRVLCPASKAQSAELVLYLDLMKPHVIGVFCVDVGFVLLSSNFLVAIDPTEVESSFPIMY
jgi:hypothetical protein